MAKWKKVLGKVASPFIKPVQKFAQKFIPKEARPWLPMATPFLPAMGIMGQLGGPMGFAKMYGANLLSQQLADPDAEFDDLNQIAALLSGTQGGLMGTDTAQNLRGMTTKGKQLGQLPAGGATMPDIADKMLADRSMWTKAKDLGLTGLAEASDYLTGTTKTLQDLGSGEAIPIETSKIIKDKLVKETLMKDLFTKEGMKALGKSAVVPFSTGIGGVTEAYQRPAIREYEAADLEEQRQIDETSTANDAEDARLTMLYLLQL